MTVKYKAMWFKKPCIGKLEVEKETKKMVIVNGKKEYKISQWHCYTDTLEDAKIFLLDKCMVRKEDAKRKIEYYKQEIDAMDILFMKINEYKED